MKFTMEMTLGNANMRDGADIAGTLRNLANRLGDIIIDPDCEEVEMEPMSGVIKDINGSTVGTWAVKS